MTSLVPWGSAADLCELLAVRPEPAHSETAQPETAHPETVQPEAAQPEAGRPHKPAVFVSAAGPVDERRPVVEGSQLLAQAMVAAARHVPDRRLVSGHFVFFRAAEAGKPLSFELDELSSGRTFSALAIQVTQDERRRAAGTLLLDTTAPDAIRHGAAPPDGPGPDGSEPLDMSMTGRDVRVVDGAYTNDPAAPIGPPVIDAWVRYHDVPDDQAIHAALLAHFTGHMSIAAALRPHAGIGQEDAHRSLSTAINAIAISVHAPVRADKWMLYHHHSTFAGDGMTHASCRVHDEAGTLIASFSVDAMVRRMERDTARVDPRSTM